MKRLIIKILFIFLITNICLAQTSIPKAQSLFMYNFTRLIEWPQSYKAGDFIIGVYGSAPILKELNSTLTGKKVSLQTVKIENYNNENEIGRCHILFIPFGKSGSIENVISKLGNQGTLIVTEKTGMIGKGSIINFVIDGNSLKFELDKAEATKRGLVISSTLEKMATM